MTKRLRIVVLGIMGRTPFAGVAWQVLHYLEGFRRLGCEVYYAEDTGDWPYDADRNTITDDCRYTVEYLARIMEKYGFRDRWVYRSAVDGSIHGMSASQYAELFERSDALINLTGATVLREEHLRVPVRIYLETDPVLSQIEVAQGHQFTINILNAHTHLYTFGENIGRPECAVPVVSFYYQTTRQPIILDWWERSPATNHEHTKNPFTTISSWKQTEKDIEWNGKLYRWSKHLEFLKFIDLPRCTHVPLQLALARGEPEAIRLLTSHGWQLLDAIDLSKEIEPYHEYILRSRGEFTVAKDQYVRLRTGWFSDRSACYLAAGRPVITQETGFKRLFPTGKGLFGFETMDEALQALEAIEADYEGNCRAAREIAVEYFAAEKVLGNLIEQAGL